MKQVSIVLSANLWAKLFCIEIDWSIFTKHYIWHSFKHCSVSAHTCRRL